MLTGPLPAWDLERRRIDVGPLVDWMLGHLREGGVRVEDLSRLHDAVGGEAARALASELCEATRALAVQRLVQGRIVAALPELPWEGLAIQAVSHVRILVPGDTRAPVPLHTDHGIGHALDERNLWIPLTPARASGALHVLPFAESMPHEIARRERGAMLVGDAPARPCDTAPGEMLLMTPLHVHGACTVREDATRVSIDVRIAPRESAFGRNPYTFVAPRGIS